MKNKSGECPEILEESESCLSDCDHDRDCSGALKCCASSCGGAVCVQPLAPEGKYCSFLVFRSYPWRRIMRTIGMLFHCPCVWFYYRIINSQLKLSSHIVKHSFYFQTCVPMFTVDQMLNAYLRRWLACALKGLKAILTIFSTDACQVSLN